MEEPKEKPQKSDAVFIGKMGNLTKVDWLFMESEEYWNYTRAILILHRFNAKIIEENDFKTATKKLTKKVERIIFKNNKVLFKKWAFTNYQIN